MAVMEEKFKGIKCVKCRTPAEYILHGLSICTKCMEGFVERASKSNSPIIKPGL